MLRGTYVTTQDLVRLRGRTQGLMLPVNPAVYRTGGFRSKILGRGMEYEKSRKYEAGDDVRMIDWRVTARTGTAHTKVFQEDRQKAVYLIVDLTSTMRFGTQVAFKSVVAAEAAAMLAWVAHSQGDLISIVGVTDHGVRHGKLASSSESLMKQLNILAKLSQTPPTDIESPLTFAEALSVVVRKVRTGDLAVVFSDLANLTDISSKALEYLSRRQSLIVCWIQDPIEQKSLPVGHYPVTDGSQYTTLHLSSAGRRKKLQSLLDQRNQAIQDMLKRLGSTNVQMTCGDEIVKVLHRTFHHSANSNGRNGSSPPVGFSRSSARASVTTRG